MKEGKEGGEMKKEKNNLTSRKERGEEKVGEQEMKT